MTFPYYPPYNKALENLIERECYWLKNKIVSLGNRKLVIFCSGPYARNFYGWLTQQGKDIEFFIDNNVALNESEIEGKKCKLRPWEHIENFKDDYFVIIASSAANYRQVQNQLDAEEISYISSDSFQIVHYWEKCKQVIEFFDDDMSIITYLGCIYYFLTYNDSFLLCNDDHYFGIRQFYFPANEFICDAGAFVGDTIEEYVKRAFGSCRIVAFEPIAESKAALDLRVERLKSEWKLNDTAIQTVLAGVSDKSGVLHICDRGIGSMISTEGKTEIKVYTIDDYFRDEHPTLIKADIEGEEMRMLKGSIEIIKKYEPKLAISIYHSIMDFVNIPEFIKKLNTNYKMAVRTHSLTYEDTVLYCWV